MLRLQIEWFGSGVIPGRVENHWSKSPSLRGTKTNSGLTEAGTAIHGKQLVGGRQAGCVLEAASWWRKGYENSPRERIQQDLGKWSGLRADWAMVQAGLRSWWHSQQGLRKGCLQAIGSLLCSRHCAKLFTYIISFHPQDSPGTEGGFPRSDSQ